MVGVQAGGLWLDSSCWCTGYPCGKKSFNVSFIFELNLIFLQDSNRIQQYFSSEKEPTLWRALPALEELQTAWETKRDDQQYALYEDALSSGLQKLKKYYFRLDEKPSFMLALGKCFCNLIILINEYSRQSFIHTTS